MGRTPRPRPREPGPSPSTGGRGSPGSPDLPALRGLAAASRAIGSTLALADVLRVAADQARELVGAHLAMTSLTGDEPGAPAIAHVSFSDRYAAHRQSGARPDGLDLFPVAGPLERPVRWSQRELEAQPGRERADRGAGAEPPLRGWLAAPLLGSDGRSLGLIQLADKHAGDFTETDEAMLVQLAQVAALQVERARLHQRAEWQRRAAERLVEVGRLVSRSLDPTEVARQVVESARALLGAECAVLSRVVAGTADLAVLAHAGDAGLMAWPGLIIPDGGRAAGLAVRQRAPVVTPDVLRDPRIAFTPEDRARVEATPWRAQLALPLIAEDTVIGALALGDRAGRVFGEHEIGVAQAFADQAAAALENARRYADAERQRREAAELARVARALNESLDLGAVSRRIVESVLPIFGARAAAVRLLRADGALVAIAWAGEGGDALKVGHVLPPGVGVTGRAVLEGRPVWSVDLLSDPALVLPDEWRRVLAGIDFRASAAVPLRTDGRVTGALSIADRHRRIFTPAEIALLESFADQAALALATARLHEEAERRRREAEVLANLAAALGASRDLETVLRQVTDAARELCGSDSAKIAIWSPDEEAMVFRYWPGNLYPDYAALRTRPGKGLGGHVMVTKRPVRVGARWVDDPRFTPDHAHVNLADRHEAELVVPILIDEHVDGLVYVSNRSRRPFTDRDETVLVQLADHAAIAIRNARVFAESERRRRIAERLAEVGRTLSGSLDRTEVAQWIASAIRELLRAHDALITEALPEPGGLRVIAVAGEGPPALEPGDVVPPGVGLVGLAVRECRLMTTADSLVDPRVRFTPEIRARLETVNHRATLHVPLVVRDRVLGALSVGDTVGRVYTAEDRELAQAFADQAAIALENARLYDEAGRRRREAEVLASVAATLGASLDLDVVLQRLVEAARELAGSDLAEVALRSSDPRILEFRYRAGPYSTAYGAQGVEHGKGAGGMAVETGRPFRTDNYAEDPRITRDYAGRIAAEGIVALLVVPILLDAQVEGLLYVENRAARPFSQDDEAILVRLADHAAVAIRNARVFAESERRRRIAETLAEVERLLSESLDPRVVAQRVADHVRTLFGALTATVFRLEPETGSLVALGNAGVTAPGAVNFRLPRGLGFSALAVQERRAVVSGDVLGDPRVRLTPALRRGFEATPLRAGLAVPLAVAGQIVGVLAVADRAGRAFSEEDARVAQAFADQAAVALENARLFDTQARLLEDTRRQHQEAEALERVARDITSSLAPEEVLQQIVEHARTLCGADLALLAPYDRATDTATVGAVAGARSETLLALTLRRGRGVGGRVLETGEPFVTDDYLVDPRISQDYASVARAEGTIAQAAVPLRARGRVTGVLAVANRTPRLFSDRDLRILGRLADQAALALENAGLFAETRARLRETETMLAVARALAQSVPAVEALRLACRELARSFGADMGGAYALEPGADLLAPVAGYHVPEDLRATLRGTPLPLAAFPFLTEARETGRPVWIADYPADARPDRGLLAAHRPRSPLFAPTRVRDEVVGGLFLVWWSRERRLTPAELRLIEGAMALIGQAVQRVRAETELAARLRQQAAVAELGRRALAAPSLQAVLDEATRAVAAGLAVERAKVLELLPGGETLLLRAGVGWREGLVGHAIVPAGRESQAGYTLSSRAPVVVDDLGTETRFSGPPLLHEHGVVSGLSVVIGSPDRPFGVLGAHTGTRRGFTPDDVRFLQSVAHVLATAIERARAEDALWQSESRFRSAFDDSRVGRALQTLDGRYLRVNRALVALLGYSEEELLATSWQALTHPDDLAAERDQDAELRAGVTRPYAVEKRYFHRGGRVIWAAVSVSVLRGPDGAPRHLLAEVEDITARKDAEARTRFQASLLDQVRNAAIATDLAGRIVYWNRHAETLYQWTTEEALGRSIFALTVPRSTRRSLEEIGAEVGATGHWEGELVVQRRDGTTFPAYVVNTLLRDTLGHPTGVIGISVDISERKRAEAALHRHLERLRSLHEIDQAILAAGSPDSIAAAALGYVGRLVPCRTASVTVFDLEAREARVLASLGQDGEAVPPGTRVPLDALDLEAVERLRQHPVRLSSDVEAGDQPGTLLRLLTAGPPRAAIIVGLGAGDRLVGALSLGADHPDAFETDHVDIAREVAGGLAVGLEQARLNQQVRGAHARLAALTRRLVAIQEEERRHIARELHDEIGQVLTGLKLSLELLARTPAKTVPARLGEALELVGDLIARVREMSLDLRPAMLDDLGLLPALLWHLERYTAQTGIGVEFTHAGVDRRFPPDVETAAYRIAQEALTNVARHAAVPRARLDVRVADGVLCLEIEDRGRGFETSSGRPSTGLTGMRERATLIGGRLAVASAPGAGTRVTATLPLDGSQTATPPDPAPG